MKRKNHKVILFIAVIFCLLIPAQHISAAKTKIRVIVKNANIRSSPSLESEVIQEQVPIGAVFQAKAIKGDWYEIKYQNSSGVLITGYIHKTYVEIQDEEPPAEKEEAVKTPQPKPVPPPQPFERKQPKGEFSIMGGLTMGSFLPDSTSYSSNWSEGVLKSVAESWTITHKINSPLGVGITFSYFLFGGIGIQARIDYNLTKEFITEESFSNYSITWSWTNSGPYSREESWSTTGNISLIPFSLNLIYKTPGSGLIRPFFSGGVSYFIGKVTLDSRIGYGDSWVSGNSRYIDYAAIPVSIDSSLNSLGFNLGGGLDYMFSSNIILTAEGRYFIGKSINADLEPVPGTYHGNNFPNMSWTLDQALADSLIGQAPPLEISTSFLKIQGGIKFLF